MKPKNTVYTVKASASKRDLKRLLLTDRYAFRNIFKVLAKKPLKVDLRDSNLFEEVMDQGPIESSIGISLVSGCLEFVFKKAYPEKSYRLSSLYVYDKDKNALFIDSRNTVTSFVDAIEVLRTKGCCPERLGEHNLATLQSYGSDEIEMLARSAKVKKAYRLERLEEVKACLVEGLPVAVLLDVYESLFGVFVYRTGEISPPDKNGKKIGQHAVTIVGYDDLFQRFTIRNSWSKSWGDHGYGYLPYYLFKFMFIEGYALKV